ncbi:vacuolar-sorting receptor 7 [Triticum aestivum]|uniref:vacuolar-sorting receptor 7 n=1 Tax=Triticum aestivum TaxID=4565 RepID=UPI001D0077F8|nr:vacuolar-sorting receptor 7-like [Triticum aestivum]XP_044428785.1 vacuolar-sorting receptor 7-like [Triticum aestivum]
MQQFDAAPPCRSTHATSWLKANSTACRTHRRTSKRGTRGSRWWWRTCRQLCVHRVANESGRPWAWWDFTMDYKLRCSMKEKKYSKACAEEVVASLGLSLEKVLACMGDPDADADNAVLSKEQEDQIGHGSRGGRHHPAHARHQRRPVQREAGEDGGAQGHVRRLQGGDRAASLPEP